MSATCVAERREPAILGAVRFALGEHDGVVLVHREQAFAAPGRAEHRERVRAGRGALAGLGHALLGQQRGAVRHGAELARDHGRDLAARQAFAREIGCDLRDDAPRRRRDRSRPAPDRCGRRAARRPRRAARSRSRAESAPVTRPASSVTPRWRTLRRFMRLTARYANASAGTVASGRLIASRHRQRERAGAVARDRAQDVALGDDAGVLRQRRAGRSDEQRRNPRRGHRVERRADRSVGADEPRRRHQVADAVAVRIAVDARARAPRCRPGDGVSLQPAR